jgi:hypothetical protein
MPCPNISGTLVLNPLPHSDSNPIIDLMSHLEPTVAVPTSHLNLISTGSSQAGLNPAILVMKLHLEKKK